MAVTVDIEVQSDRAVAFLHRVKASFDNGEHHKVVATVAAKSFARVVTATPKGFTGNLRQQWQMTQAQPGEWHLFNLSKVMRFIEYGTKAHGPVRAKALYIPKTRSAAVGGWRKGLVYGKDYVLAKWVRGITARHIVRAEKERAQEELGNDMRKFLVEILS